MVNLAIFQDVNFIYDVRMYAIIEVARSRISLTPVSPLMERPGTPLYSDTEGIFGKENSAVIHLLSMVARFEDICSSFCACSPSRTSLHLLAIPLRRTFFFSILRADSLSLAWTLLVPFTKGTTGAWSILLMAHTRVVVDLGLKNRVVCLHCHKRTT